MAIEQTAAGAVISLPAAPLLYHVMGLWKASLVLMLAAGAGLLVAAGAVPFANRFGQANCVVLAGAVTLFAAASAWRDAAAVSRHRNGCPPRIRLLLTSERVWAQPPGGERVIGAVIGVDVVPHGPLARFRRRLRPGGGRATVRVITGYCVPLPLATGIPRPQAAHLRSMLRLPTPVVPAR